MVDFYIYDNITGEILSIGSAPEDMVSLQLVGDNESIGLGIVDPETQYFDVITETVEDKTVSPVTVDTTITNVVTQADHDNGIWEWLPVGTVLTIADGSTLVGFENIPTLSELYLNEEFLVSITDGTLEFSLDLPSYSPTVNTFKRSGETVSSTLPLEIKSPAHFPFQANIYAA